MLLRYPGFKYKAVALSYDDGHFADYKMLEILNKYGIKCTFNMSPSMLDKEDRVKSSELVSLYINKGHEVAVHGYYHSSLTFQNPPEQVSEITRCRAELEKATGRIINGMAYANGLYNDETVNVLKTCGIIYSRTTESTHTFYIPIDWLKLHPTCHHDDPELMNLVKKFYEDPVHSYYWANQPRLFLLWGHSFEFHNKNNWNVLEDFCRYISNKDDVWYATLSEIYYYDLAFKRLAISYDQGTIYNPSAIDVYFNLFGKDYIVRAGETIKVENSGPLYK